MNELEGVSKLLQDWNVDGWIGSIFTLVIIMITLKKYMFNGFGGTLTGIMKDYMTLESSRVETLTKTEKDIHQLITELKKVTDFILQDRETYGARIDKVESLLMQEVQAVNDKVCHVHRTVTGIYHNMEKRGVFEGDNTPQKPTSTGEEEHPEKIFS